MLKLILQWLIIVTFFINQFAFAGQVSNRSVASPSVSSRVDESIHVRRVRVWGNVCNALTAVGRFCHNHSDFICRTSILACDVVYFLGTFFPGSVLTPAANVSFMLLNYVGLIGVPFAVREAIKALGDTRYACKRGCKEMVLIGSLRTSSNTLSALTIPAYSVAATLLYFERTYNSGMAIFNYSKPLGFVFIILNPSLDVYNFFLGRRIIRALDRDTSPDRTRNQITLLRGMDVEGIPASEEKLSALMRSQIDLVTWGKFLETTRVEEQVPLLSRRAEVTDVAIVFGAIIDNIRTNRNYAVGDLMLNILFDVEMGVMRVSGPGKIMAVMDLGSAVMCDTILGIKKLRQAIQRARLQQVASNRVVEQEPGSEIGAIETLEGGRDQSCIRTTDLPRPDFVVEVVPDHEPATDRYAFMLAENPDIPLEVRIVAAHGCNPLDSLVLVNSPAISIEVREVAAHHCTPTDSCFLVHNPDIPLELRRAAAHHCDQMSSYDIAMNEGLDVSIRAAAVENCEEEACASILHNLAIPIEVRRVAEFKTSLAKLVPSHRTASVDTTLSSNEQLLARQGSIVPYNADRAEESQPLLPDRGSLSSREDEECGSLSREDLFNIASDPNKSLDERCGAAYLLH